jgi:hypothetical protein
VSPADRARAASAERASVERDVLSADELAAYLARKRTPTERLHELAMAHATRPLAAPEHSCDLTRNAKGQTQISLTVRGTELLDVMESAVLVYDRLRARYPLPSGYVGAEGEPQGGAK